MKRFFILIYVLVLICACHSRATETGESVEKKSDTAKKNYLPVAYYLQAEISAVDSFPLRIMRYDLHNGKTDSGMITTVVFDQLAKEFLVPDLDSARFEGK